MNEILLRGCAPEPLIHYLKALGILRLVAEQLDPQARAAWHGDTFMLETEKTKEDLIDFFLNRYRPTPIVAPWNNGSGFHTLEDKASGGGKKVRYIRNIEQSTNSRFEKYRDVITAARMLLAECMTPQMQALSSTKRSEALKPVLLPKCRTSLSDEVIEWLDAVCVLFEEEDLGLPPLLGSAGNDGNFEFSLNFMGRLHDVISTEGAKRPKSENQLRAALFANVAAALEKAAIGQFHPGGAGGANSSQGPDGDAYVNPWDFILALEGSLMLASATVRQLAAGARTKASFPFTVRNSNIGYGTATDNEKVRAEIWLPLWSRSTGYAEVAHIFKEGRVQFSDSRGRNKAVRTGFDFARAIAELGVDRGINAFQRYAFIERNGQANLATPLGVFEVRERSLVSLIHELDRGRWLDSFTRASSDEKQSPPRFVRARKRIEEAIFRLCATGRPEHLRETLLALGEAEAELANGDRFREEAKKRNVELRPLKDLSLRWVRECDDHSHEFRMATSLAAVSGAGKVGALRSNLEPFDSATRNWSQRSTSAIWSAAALEENLAAVLQRRSIDARSQGLSHPPIASSRFASLKAVDAFLKRETDDEKIVDLLRGLILIDWTNDEPFESKSETRVVPPTLSRAYALLKLLFLPAGEFQPKPDGETIIIKHEPSIIPLLRAGRIPNALDVASRRLRASGVMPLTTDFHLREKDGTRLASALLIPIDEPSRREIARLVLRDETED